MRVFIVYEGLKNKYNEVLESRIKNIFLYESLAKRKIIDLRKENQYSTFDYWYEEEIVTG